VSGFEAALVPVGQALLSGLLVGGVYGLLSIGFSLAFGVMRIVNFAHGELVMYGMYVGVVSATFGIDPLFAIPFSFLFMGLLGAAQYQLVYKRFVGAATLQQLLVAIGLGLVLQMLAQVIFGADTRSAPSMFGSQYLLIGPLFISAAQVVAFVVAVIATIAVEALLLGTHWGRTVRAVADDIEAAELVGLSSQWINISAFALACGLAGIAGTIMVTYYPTDPSKGLSLMPIAIIATTIGGLGSIRGSFLGGIFCGMVQQLTAMLWNSALQDVPLYVLLLLFIAYRPTGMFGFRTE
jgi:branched-chain amino acid transport system permease protein